MTIDKITLVQQKTRSNDISLTTNSCIGNVTAEIRNVITNPRIKAPFAKISENETKICYENTTETKQTSLDDLSVKCNSKSFNGELKWKL